MPFKENDNNINRTGRPKGAINKENKELRQYLSYYLETNKEKFETEINKLSGIQFVSMYIKLIEYTTPKLNRIDLISDNETINNMTESELDERIKELEEKNRK